LQVLPGAAFQGCAHRTVHCVFMNPPHPAPTLLPLALGCSTAPVVRALLRAGADVNVRAREGLTPVIALARASTGDAEERLRALLAAGADLAAQSWDGSSMCEAAQGTRLAAIVDCEVRVAGRGVGDRAGCGV
jgi:hypothetical protein